MVPLDTDFAPKLLQGLTGLASVFIAYFVYRLGNQQRRDSWFRSFNELHQGFWSDGDFREVRTWIANDQKYSELDVLLAKRFKGRDILSQNEYLALEKLDKFFNFFLRVRAVAAQMRGHDDLWDRLYFQYWMDDIVKARRYRLWRYFEVFYEANAAHLPITRPHDEFSTFKAEACRLCGDVDA